MAQYLLLPGAGGDPWYWHLVTELLRGKGHVAVPVDLPADDDRCALPEYVDVAVEAACGLDDIALVAQSLGGFTAAMAASRLPVRAVAFINAMIPLPGETPGAWWAATGHAAAYEAARGDDPPHDDFTHDLSYELVAALTGRNRRQGGAVFDSPCRFHSWPSVPLHVLVGAEDRFFPPEFQRQVCRERLGLEPTLIPGGHAIALSQPVAVSHWLDCVVAS